MDFSGTTIYAFEYLEDTLESTLGCQDEYYVDQGYTKEFSHETSLIQLVKGSSHKSWLCIYQPTISTQNIISEVIEPLMGLNVEVVPFTNIQQVEFAYNVYPLCESDLPNLRWWLEMYTVLKYSRKDSFSKFGETTIYQGKDGNVRNGSCGLTQYPNWRDDRIFTRLEVQLNRPALKRKKIDLESLPLTPSFIDPFDYIGFRQNLDRENLEKLVASIIRRKFRNGLQGSPMRKNFTIHSIRRSVMKAIFSGEDHNCNTIESTNTPVPIQIDNFKKLKKAHRITNQDNVVFPKIGATSNLII